MNTRVPISVLIPIKNEAANLPRCLDCVKWADEIFVVDSQSVRKARWPLLHGESNALA